jgi:hypothetical protein
MNPSDIELTEKIKDPIKYQSTLEKVKEAITELILACTIHGIQNILRYKLILYYS